jgi:hypothetical protein
MMPTAAATATAGQTAAGFAGTVGLGTWAPWSAPPAAATGAQESSASVKVLQDKARKDAYRSELEAQIRDKAARKAAEKNALKAADAKKEAEMAAYSPWGRAGAGAPLRDADGKVGAAKAVQHHSPMTLSALRMLWGLLFWLLPGGCTSLPSFSCRLPATQLLV